MPDGPPGKRPRTLWLAYTAQDSQKSSASCDGNIPAKAPGRGETRPPMHEFGSDSPFGLPSRSVETARSAQAWGIAPLRGAGGVILFGPRSNESVGSPCGGIEIAKRGSPPSRTRDRFLRTILRMPARTSRAPARSPPSASTRPTPLGPRPLGSTACPTTGGTLGFRPPQTCVQLLACLVEEPRLGFPAVRFLPPRPLRRRLPLGSSEGPFVPDWRLAHFNACLPRASAADFNISAPSATPTWSSSAVGL